MKVLVVLSPGFEETEAICVIDVLRRAKLDVVTASLEPNQTVLGSHGIPIVADAALHDLCEFHDKPLSTQSEMLIHNVLVVFDALVLPGGMRGVQNMLHDVSAEAPIPKLAAAFAEKGKTVAAVCAAPLVLLKAGVLQGHRFTCHPCVFDQMEAAGLHAEEQPAVTDGNIVTGRSAGCALPWAIALVKKLTGSADSILGGLAIL